MTETGKEAGSAFEVEVQHKSRKWDAEVYVRRYDEEFGLGQQSGIQEGTEQVGGAVRYRVNEQVDLGAEIYRDTDLASDRSRDVIDSRAVYATEKSTYGLGVRTAKDTGGGKRAKESQQVTANAQTELLEGRLRLRATGDTELAGGEESPGYPTRVVLGADYRVSENINLTGEQEFGYGDSRNTQSTRLGVQATPWKGFGATSSMARQGAEGGGRLFANYGVKQVWDFGEKWTFDFGADRSQTIRKGVVASDQVNPNAEQVRGDLDGDFTAVFAGANYHLDTSELAFRAESRQADKSDRWNLIAGYQRDLLEGVAVAGILDLRDTKGKGRESMDASLRLGLAYRPLDSRWIFLDKLEVVASRQAEGGFDITSRKIVNNLNANYQWTPETQVAFQYGLKYVVDNIDNESYKGFTDLLGLEVRRQVNDKWDVGLGASVLHSWNTDAIDYSYGISVGRTFATNMWASFGYNIEGFTDSDFDDADYTAKGLYLKVRFKFDQVSVKQAVKGEGLFDKSQ